MKIRYAVQADFDRIMEIYVYARNYMIEHGNPNQWGADWPPVDAIQKDIDNHECYVCTENDKVVGVFSYDYGEQIEPTYNQIDGDWIGGEEYGVIHRMASDGSVKGVGAFCIDWAFKQCHHLRIDTHHDNKTMQNLLTKLGFKQCGIIYIARDHSPRLAYEKIS